MAYEGSDEDGENFGRPPARASEISGFAGSEKKKAVGLGAAAGTFWDTFLADIHAYVKKYTEPTVKRIATELERRGIAKALPAEKALTTTVMLSTLFAKQLGQTGVALKSALDSTRKLHAITAPIAEANGENSILSFFAPSSNEVFAAAQKKIATRFFMDIKHMGVGAVVPLLNMGFVMQENSAKLAEIEKKETFKNLEKMSPEAQAAFWEKELGVVTHGASGQDYLNAVLKHQQERYTEKFKTFEKENKSKLEKQLKDKIGANLLGKSGEANGPKDWHIAERERYGLGRFNVSPSSRYGSRSAADLSNDRRAWSKAVDEAVEKAVKAEFVRQEGAFDQTWARYADFGEESRGYGGRDRERDKTIKEQVTERFNKYWDEMKGVGGAKAKTAKEEEAAQKAMAQRLASGGASIASQYIDHLLFGQDGVEHDYAPGALDYILHLRAVCDQFKNDEFPKTVPALTEGKTTIGGGSLSRYLVDMVQAHMRGNGKPKIHESYYQHLETEGFDDKKLLNAPREELSEFEVIIAELVKHITKERDMDPAALADILGDTQHGRKLIRGNDDFGPAGFSGSTEERKAAIVSAIDSLARHVKQHVELTNAEKSEKKGELALDIEKLKKAFAPDGDRQRQAFLLSCIERFLPEEKDICELTGMKPEQCKALHEAGDSARESGFFGAASQVASDWLNEGEEAWQKVHKLRLLAVREKSALKHVEKEAREGNDVVVASSSADFKAASAVMAAVALVDDGWSAIARRYGEMMV
ncbi:MAG: hypothetical protein JO089_03875, partial [Alphaproteobacteria bacterium]|nr:hypothetical protein [Alphaproteobacteria bacterium]